MRKKLRFGAFFLSCLLLGLVLNMPVTHLLAQVTLPKNIRPGHVDGTIFHGRIQSLSIDRIQINAINYQFQPGCLLGLRICYGLDFDQGRGDLGASLLSQNLTFDGFQIEYPLENLSVYADQLFVQPSGNLQVDISSLTLKQNKLLGIDAVAVWRDAGIVGESINLGDYELKLSSQKQAYQFTLNDRKAVLAVDGRGELKSNGQYTANISIQSQPGLNNQIKTALEFIAKKQGLNKYNIRRTGKLPGRLMSKIEFPE